MNICYYSDTLSLSHFLKQKRIRNGSDEVKSGDWEESGISDSEDGEGASGIQFSDTSG